MKFSEGLGETNICSLALGTRRSNIDADAAHLRRIDVNITSFDNVTKFSEGWMSKHPLTSFKAKTKQYWRRCSALAPHRRQYYVVLDMVWGYFHFIHCASLNSYCTTVHGSQWAKAVSEQFTPSKCNADVYAAARATSASKSGQNVSRPVITRGNIDDVAALLRRIDVNITPFDNPMTSGKFFRRLGGANISSLALGTRRSNIDADAAL